MEESEDIQKVWDWLKEHRPKEPQPAWAFNAQNVDPEGRELPGIVDAIWQLATANLIQPQSIGAYRLTELGRNVIEKSISPYQTNVFIQETNSAAPQLDPDALAYLALALECVYGIPQAAVALTRVAIETELDSLIDAFVNWADPNAQVRKKLQSRDLSQRAEVLIGQLRSRPQFDREELNVMESCTRLCRIAANRVLHPKQGMPTVSSLDVEGIFYCFLQFATVSSRLKENQFQQ